MPEVGFIAGALDRCGDWRSATGLQRWWPASQRDGIAELDGALLDGIFALLTAARRGLFRGRDPGLPSSPHCCGRTPSRWPRCGRRVIGAWPIWSRACAKLTQDNGVAVGAILANHSAASRRLRPGGGSGQHRLVRAGHRDGSAITELGGRASGSSMRPRTPSIGGSPSTVGLSAPWSAWDCRAPSRRRASRSQVRSGALHGAVNSTPAAGPCWSCWTGRTFRSRNRLPGTDWRTVEVMVGAGVDGPRRCGDRVRAFARGRGCGDRVPMPSLAEYFRGRIGLLIGTHGLPGSARAVRPAAFCLASYCSSTFVPLGGYRPQFVRTDRRSVPGLDLLAHRGRRWARRRGYSRRPRPVEPGRRRTARVRARMWARSFRRPFRHGTADGAPIDQLPARGLGGRSPHRASCRWPASAAERAATSRSAPVRRGAQAPAARANAVAKTGRRTASRAARLGDDSTLDTVRRPRHTGCSPRWSGRWACRCRRGNQRRRADGRRDVPVAAWPGYRCWR